MRSWREEGGGRRREEEGEDQLPEQDLGRSIPAKSDDALNGAHRLLHAVSSLATFLIQPPSVRRQLLTTWLPDPEAIYSRPLTIKSIGRTTFATHVRT